MKLIKFASCMLFASLSLNAFAQDKLEGIWQQIDDKSGSGKAIIQIKKENNDTYTGKIIKVTPRIGYRPREYCNNCPGEYNNQTILGMDILKNLRPLDTNLYHKGKIIDPLTGTVYDASIRVAENGKSLRLRAYIGIASLGRTQTWLRIN